MSTLVGGDGLRRRLTAIQHSRRTMARRWADSTVDAMKPMVPVKTGRGRSSVRVKSADDGGAQVEALDYVAILDAGAKPHDISPKSASILAFDDSGRTYFAPKVRHPGQRGLGFSRKAVDEGMRRTPMSETLIDAWNKAD